MKSMGLNQIEIHNFTDYLIKANHIQLRAMAIEMLKEIKKRKTVQEIREIEK